jgi:signal transduction histidine kinase
VIKKLLLLYLLILCLKSHAGETDSLQNILSNSAFSVEQKAKAANALSYYFISISSIKAIEYAKLAIEYGIKINSVEETGRGHYNLGYCYLYNDEYILALKEFLWVQSSIVGISKTHLRGDIYDAIGEMYGKLNYHNKAYYYYTLALKEAQKINDSAGIAYSYVSIGKVLRDLYKLDSSVNAFRKALAFFELSDDNAEQEAFANIELGRVFTKLNNKDSALLYFNKAEKVLTEKGFLLELSQSYLYKGYVFLIDKKLDEASNNFIKANKIAANFNDEILKADIYNSWGDMSFARNKFDSARFFYSKALESYIKFGKKQKLLNTYAHIIQTAYLLNDKEEFNKLTDNYWNYLTMHKEDEVAAEIEKIMADFDDTNTEKQLKIQEERNQFQKQRFVILVILFVLVIVSFIWLFNLYKQRSIVLQEQLLQAKALKESNESLEKSVQLKNKIFSIISHDLRAPLTSAYQMFDMLNKGQIEPNEFEGFSVQLQHELYNSLHLTDNLLHWAKGQSLQIEPQYTSVNIAHIIKDTVNSLSGLINNKQLTVHSSIKDTFIETDSTIFQIILRNVLSNAIKFTLSGKTISIKLEEIGGKKWLLVKDEGVGMTEKQLHKLINQNIHSSLGTENERGAGIGMRLVFDMAVILNKEVRIKSQINEGTSVEIEL